MKFITKSTEYSRIRHDALTIYMSFGLRNNFGGASCLKMKILTLRWRVAYRIWIIPSVFPKENPIKGECEKLNFAIS